MDLKTVDELLTTTRSVRKRLDLNREIDPAIVEECIELALQAPTGANRQGWHFVVVTDEEKRAKIADYYKQAWDVYSTNLDAVVRVQTENPDQVQRIMSSGDYLATNMAKVPMMIIPCIMGLNEGAPLLSQASIYGSILPAAWSLMLALRSRGVGTSWTTLHLAHEKPVAELLGIPEDFRQVVLLPCAYFTGETFKPANRLPGKDLTSWDTWGNRRD